MDVDNRGDNEIITSFKTGNHQDFDILIERYSTKLYQIAFGMLSNQQDAEEVVQDAFVRAFRALDKFRGDAKFSTWIHRIVSNLARNRYHWNRRRGAKLNVSLYQPKRSHDDTDDEHEMLIPDNSMGPGVMLEGAELEQEVMSEFNRLPEKLKQAMLLRHVSEFSYEKIAQTLECKVGTVKSRIARGREIMRNKFNAAKNYEKR
ncbi:MAG: sigma-70 family RNA polymerase sigma factor [Victivallaceae bacterium]|nr:sigma-70 family RNA polymerase sigma factor [Victivallaceae bacterium]